MSEPIHRSPAFQFYADDFIAGTADMSAEEVGAFIRLLCHQWSKGSIPADEERSGRIAGLLGSPSLRYALAKFLLCDDGQLRNARLEQVRAESAKYRAKQVESGKAGASKRWSNPQKHGDPNRVPMPTLLPTPMAKGCPNDSSPSPSPSPVIPPNPPEGVQDGKPPAEEKPADAPKKKRRERKPVERNLPLDAIVEACGGDLAATTRSAWAQAAKALSDIKEVAPEVTPEEIKAKAGAYRKAHPEWELTPTALAKHWGSLTERKQGSFLDGFDWRDAI